MPVNQRLWGIYVSEVRVATYVHDPDRPDHRVRAQGRRRARTGAAAASASGRSNVVGCRSCSGRTEGLNVPMREIARRAWVGPATLYRRFPAKDLLVTEVFTAFASCSRKSVSCTHAAEASPRPSCRPSPTQWIEPPAASFEPRIRAALDRRLGRRAKVAGHLRSDFLLDDLILILMANSGIRATSPAAAVAASRRFAALAIQAFQASPEASPLPSVARLASVVLIR